MNRPGRTRKKHPDQDARSRLTSMRCLNTSGETALDIASSLQLGAVDMVRTTVKSHTVIKRDAMDRHVAHTFLSDEVSLPMEA
jgi:hypothetical protein